MLYFPIINFENLIKLQNINIIVYLTLLNKFDHISVRVVNNYLYINKYKIFILNFFIIMKTLHIIKHILIKIILIHKISVNKILVKRE